MELNSTQIDQMEAKYKDLYEAEVLKRRTNLDFESILNGCFIFFLCFFLDYVIYPEYLYELWACRALFIVCGLCVCLNIKFAKQRIHTWTATFFLQAVSALSVFIMLLFIDDSRSPYIFVVMVNSIIITLHYGIRIREAVFYNILHYLSFLVSASLMSGEFDTAMAICVLVNQMFIVIYAFTQLKYNRKMGLLSFGLSLDNEKQKAEIEKQNELIVQNQDVLIQAGKMASIGEMTTVLMHEIKNPLNHISGALNCYSTMSQIGEVSKEEAEDVIKDVKLGVDQICSITKELNNYSYNETKKMSAPTNLRSILDSAQRLTTDKLSNIKVKVLCPEVDFIAAENQLIQVFVNLLNNSIAVLDNSPGSEISIGARVEGENIIIDYKDNGPGIDEAIVDNLFEPFVTTKSKGNGLGVGLRITQMIVEGHHGSIQYEGNDPGAHFTISMPIVNRT